MKVYIMRGLPGSGKDHWLEVHMQNKYCRIFSADDYRINGFGVYEFKREREQDVHDRCFRGFIDVVTPGPGFDYLVCNNTNLGLADIAPYVRVVEAFKLDYEIIQIHADPVTCMKRNIHGVPPATIWAMYQNLIETRLPAYYKVRHVYE